MRGLYLLLLLAVGAAACAAGRNARPPGRTVNVTLTAVPLLTKEMAAVYPFLKQDFAAEGVLHGKEVYAFIPSSVTVIEGDTVRLELINPEDDDHNFVLPDLSVKLRGESITHAVWHARRPGIYPFYCTIPAHMPMMHGQIVVLARRALR